MQVTRRGSARAKLEPWVPGVVVGLITFPFALMLVPIGPTWTRRTVGTGTLFAGLLIAAASIALLRKPDVLNDVRRRAELRSWRVTAAFYYGGRVFGAVAGLAFLWYSGIPFVADLATLGRDRGPERIVAAVSRTDVSFPPIPILFRRVWLANDRRPYILCYFFSRLSSGDIRVFTVLRRSHVIVDVNREARP